MKGENLETANLLFTLLYPFNEAITLYVVLFNLKGNFKIMSLKNEKELNKIKS